MVVILTPIVLMVVGIPGVTILDISQSVTLPETKPHWVRLALKIDP